MWFSILHKLNLYEISRFFIFEFSNFENLKAGNWHFWNLSFKNLRIEKCKLGNCRLQSWKIEISKFWIFKFEIWISPAPPTYRFTPQLCVFILFIIRSCFVGFSYSKIVQDSGWIVIFSGTFLELPKNRPIIDPYTFCLSQKY